MFFWQTAWSCSLRDYLAPAYFASEGICTGMVLIIMFLIFFPLILTVHWFILLKVFVLSKSSGRFAGLLHASLPAWYNSTSVVLQTAYPFLCFICAHELSITQKHILSTPHVKTSESALLAYRDQRIMHVADVKLYFIFLYSHLHSLHSR